MHRCIFKALANNDRIVCGLFIALAQIRRAKLRCTCHGAIFERVLVRRTQEYKSIPRTTSRKSPEIAHVRRHGSLPCMPLFSPREPRFRRCVRSSRGVFSRHMSGKRRVIIWTKRQQAKPVFSSRSSFGKDGGQRSHFAERSLAEGEYHCFSGKARKTFRTSSLFTITYNFSLRAPLSFSRCVFAEQNELL